MTQTYLDLLSRFRSRRILVVGDFLLDQYIIGNSARVSREAPIVVIDYIESVNHPGGAANASQNIAALGARAVALGIIGADREGETLRALLESRGVDASGLLADAAAATPTKLRILAGEMNAQKQQVARVDRSPRLQEPVRSSAAAMQFLKKEIQLVDAVLVSDYGLGLVPGPLSDTLIELARARSIPVVVDSRFSVMRFRGATVATPNEVEALAALGVESEDELPMTEAGPRLVAKSGIDSFLVTRGSKGMLVFAGGRCDAVDIVGSREATDVTGAGDTVSAIVSLALSCGADLRTAAAMATFGAAVVVMKRGTATASADELSALIRAHSA